jgi:phytanoyl-CoA hydroxylase
MYMDYSIYQEDYDRDGFVIVRNFLSEAELAELVSNIKRFLRELAPNLPDTQVFHADGADGTRYVRQIHRMEIDQFFAAYQTHPKWVALASAVLGEDVLPRSPIYFNKPPGSDFPTPPHQDNYAFALNPPSGIEFLLALWDRFDEENGCVYYVRGSHLAGRREPKYSGVRGFAMEVADYGPADQALEVPAILNPGDVICHHPWVIHRAGRNDSRDRTRAGFGMWFRGVSAQVESTEIDVYNENARRAHAVGN